MKKLILLLISSTFLLSSCAIHNGLTTNINNHTTEVVLSKKNFKVIDNVQGEAHATYILSIGGLAKKALIAEARVKMLADANIVGKARAIVNETAEIKFTFLPFFRRYKVIVSGHVIEFTE